MRLKKEDFVQKNVQEGIAVLITAHTLILTHSPAEWKDFQCKPLNPRMLVISLSCKAKACPSKEERNMRRGFSAQLIQHHPHVL